MQIQAGVNFWWLNPKPYNLQIRIHYNRGGSKWPEGVVNRCLLPLPPPHHLETKSCDFPNALLEWFGPDISPPVIKMNWKSKNKELEKTKWFASGTRPNPLGAAIHFEQNRSVQISAPW